ncbi:Plasmid stabilization system protein ParE [Pseudobutyrivibrio sp. NOR37]|uniref:Type II toxin-antitoxin system RelE/ParE family toxin n=1 Tax=Pseudobutyrivibrio xylanivorans TaxID=185007 RepID=A0A6M0LDA3_PSEXY|nr:MULTISPECIES: type II toxin-antitoxin system RelE/ParE family toxin [Pseudobutyrivibrio]NEX00436.1 type II toxin-antitoxin system RelE/ParE family toxin [Pseudobutyrivibrio xylanivorans]SFR59538.1 Plasmid stabilization system protein ParE [Pseudobutyrivibrio sp. NOR37]
MAFKKYNYALTEIAAYDVDEVISYIQEELSNPEAAISFADELEEKLEDICKNPKNGRLVENEFLRRDDVRRFLVGNYIVYYFIDDENNRIVILRLVYGKRNQGQIVKDFK